MVIKGDVCETSDQRRKDTSFSLLQMYLLSSSICCFQRPPNWPLHVERCIRSARVHKDSHQASLPTVDLGKLCPSHTLRTDLSWVETISYWRFLFPRHPGVWLGHRLQCLRRDWQRGLAVCSWFSSVGFSSHSSKTPAVLPRLDALHVLEKYKLSLWFPFGRHIDEV